MSRVLVALGAAVLVVLALLPAAGSAHDKEPAPTAGISVPLVMSPNVRLVTTKPETAAISGEFSRTGSFFYVSSSDSITVYDTTVPTDPIRRGVLANLVFENEAMTYGERTVDGKLRRFVLVGNDLFDVAVDPHSGPVRGRVGGGQVLVVDVTDPDDPHLAGRTPDSSSAPGVVTTSTHTVQCLTVSCEYAYTAGDGGEFSIVDLRDLSAPKQIATAPSPASGPNDAFAGGSGHYWDIEPGTGLAWHTGSGGAAVFDVRNPLAPVPVNATDEHGLQTPWNDFIHHNSQRPNGSRFSAGAAPSVANGNVLLVTEEDYFQDGEQLACDKAGTFQTWHVQDLDGAAYRAGNPGLAPGKGTVTPLDIINPVKFGDGLSTPVGGFCSAHWFDYHQSGIVAQGYYQQGLRFIDTRDSRDLKQYAYVTGGASEVWDAYWVPERNKKGVATGKKTNVVYTADLVRGLDVFQVDVPSKDLSADGGGLLGGVLP